MPDTPGDAVAAWLRALTTDVMTQIMSEMTAQVVASINDLREENRLLRLELKGMPSTEPIGSAPAPADPAPQPLTDPTPPVVVMPTQPTPVPQGDSRVEITSATGEVWPVELPEADNARIMLEVPAEIAGSTSLRLVVDHGRRGGVRWADVWLRNDVSMREGGGEARYSVQVVLDSQDLLRQEVPRHQQYRCWGRLVSAGTLPATPWPDAKTLRAAGVANYQGPVDAALIEKYAASMAAWSNDPFDPRGIALYMPGVGGRDDIGPTTAPSAIALMTRDERMRAYVVAQAEAAGTIPWHHWDAKAGTYLRVTDWPRLWTDLRGGEAGKGTLLQPVPEDTGWTLDIAHQPDNSFVAWLITGRRSFLDNLQAQAAWNVIAQWQDTRGDSDMLIVNRVQVRGAAWGLRQIDEAAWASPEGSAEKAYFTAVSQANWRWIVDNIPIWTALQGEAHGWFPGEYGTEGALPPWQQDYFASTAFASARRGNADARKVLEWMRNFLVGRFPALGHDGAAYLLANKSGSKILNTWPDIAKQTKARKWSNGTGWGKNEREGNYGQWALATLAGYVELFNDADARRWFDWLKAEGAPFTTAADYQRDPLLSIALASPNQGT